MFAPEASAITEPRLLEETLRQLTGVVSARLFATGDEVTEVHILSDGVRHPKQVARDVESCLAARFGVHVDHRRISIAQLDAGTATPSRLQILSLLHKAQGADVVIEVELARGELVYRGRAQGPASNRNRLLLTAQATLDAARQATDLTYPFIAEDVGCYDVGGVRTVAALVTFSDGRSEEALVGSAIVRRDELDATVRAALSALNRRLALFLHL